ACPTVCTGDCDGDGTVTVDELLRGVGIALASTPRDACVDVDRDGDRRVTADELIGAVQGALYGCPVATPDPPATPSASPTPVDLAERPLPDWYADAKLGIMIHWGPFAVPAWAERTLDPEVIFTDPTDPNYFFSAQGVEAFLQHNPYSEWYRNSVAIEGSGTWQHHRDTWGADFPYDGFAPLFEAQLDGWQPTQWATIFQQAGARYVVLVTKHHDGYTLWPSEVENPQRDDAWHSSRDIVGELSTAVRDRCLRMGLYYSGGIDWTWTPPPFQTLLDALQLTPLDPAYAQYVDAHWRELIQRYQPSVLWNDIGAPPAQDSEQLFRDYYAAVADGVVNDRWTAGSVVPHRDFRTAEFSVEAAISPDKWEAVRGMSRGFGYNQNETDADYGSPEKFVHLLIDVVAKNGNLLLNVGPRADGSIPAPQLRILSTLGTWLAANGEAIYATRPWTRFGATTDQGIDVRFTADPARHVVFAILLGTPAAGDLTIDGFDATPAAVRVVASGAPLAWSLTESGLRVTLPALPADGLAHALAIELTDGTAQRATVGE
ncbi:MAG: alpha-L-fucosidase, partial [Candidatus Binatia bacterium]